jgi:amidase
MSEFVLQEATISSVHRAFRSGRLTAAQLVELYLRRIEAYDRRGPDLTSVINVNERAAERAAELDRRLRDTGELVGPLHGVPVLVKDQVETADVKTTFGSIAFKDYQPSRDATLIGRLREAGAIILAKTVLPDFATSWWALSSAGGETRNPYALDRDPGGSSSGTGAAVAANLGLVGIGEDTGGSIRVPSSFCNLVGVRVTTGLISRTGMSPLVGCQDTAGPMTRTVADAARMLDVLVGYDPADPFTAVAVGRGGYSAAMMEDALVGARIGVVRGGFGPDTDPDMGKTNAVVRKALNEMASAGAEIVDDVEIPDLMDFVVRTSLYILQSRHDFNAYIASLPGAPVRSFDQIYKDKQFHPGLDLMEAIADGPSDPEEDPAYFRGLAGRQEFQRTILNVMAERRLDAIAYPDVQLPAPLKSDVHAGRWTTLTFPTNTLIASQADLPAVSVPAGLTDDGLPVGMQLVGRPYDEPRLLGYGYAFEAARGPRVPPASTPPLSDEP